MTTAKEVPSIWTTGWTDVFNTGTWRSVVPVHQRRPSPCYSACPVGGEIPRWIQFVREKDYHAAWLVLLEHNPFPAVTGRICHHPCEASCNRSQYDGAVAIKALERFLGDLALAEGWEIPLPRERRPEKIAVVGGGPAGLSCAYQLARRGYAVEVFEARSEAGGILRYGIPEYRLPKKVLHQEIRRLLELGLTIHVNAAVGPDDFDGLAKQYEAVFVAPGAGKGKRLAQLNYGDRWVLDGLEFLERVNSGRTVELGPQVVVIGGGSSAMDVARTARRLGCQVKILALETREIMPAQPDEVEEALEEGITLIDGAMLENFALAGKDLVRLHCVRVTLDRNVPSGVLKPVPLPGTNFTFEANTVIVSIGQELDLTVWQPVLETAEGLLRVNEHLATSRAGVFAGGDAASRHRFVSAALGAGKQAALSISRYLSGGWGSPSLFAGDATEVAFNEINTFYFPPLPRVEQGKLRAADRLAGFPEVRLGLSEEQAQTEAERCFSCGYCVHCDNCFYFCPDMAVVRKTTPGEVYSVLEQYCKGCGLCAEECPRGAVTLKEETR